ncbi:MAG TPA: methyltransferase domain-containing protein [Deltaproteobacteria bacterium]|nr:methyltransferase domain-containing protein [Deltaproteobacteria bacterium]
MSPDAEPETDETGTRADPTPGPDGTGRRFGLFLCDCSDPELLEKTLSRVPRETADAFDEVVIMLDRPSPRILSAATALLDDRRANLRIHRPPRHSGPGAIRKEAFEYALRKNFDHAVIMRGDGSHPPEALPDLIRTALSEPEGFVLAIDGAGSTSRRPSRRLATFVQNRILGMRLHDHRAAFRIYPCEALARIPFQLDADGPLFDVEVVLQLRALGIPIRETPIRNPSAGPGPRTSAGSDTALDLLGCATALAYRLHQVHVTRDGRFLVDHDIHYTLKRSKTGSHVQIVSAVAPGSSVLDLGCSNGLLARPLRDKNVRVTGVDVGPGESLSRELAEYHQRDLELPLELPYGRSFDYVVCADVIEHLRNRAQLLRGARRYLKPDGRLIISTPNIALWFYRLSLLIGRFEYGPRGILDETHVHLYTGSTFRREVEKAGFSIRRQRVTSLPFEVVFESTGRSRFIRGLETVYHALARLWPSLFAYQYILEGEITTLDEEATLPSDDPSRPEPATEQASKGPPPTEASPPEGARARPFGTVLPRVDR